jgi:hypothetical protein
VKLKRGHVVLLDEMLNVKNVLDGRDRVITEEGKDRVVREAFRFPNSATYMALAKNQRLVRTEAAEVEECRRKILTSLVKEGDAGLSAKDNPAEFAEYVRQHEETLNAEIELPLAAIKAADLNLDVNCIAPSILRGLLETGLLID